MPAVKPSAKPGVPTLCDFRPLRTTIRLGK